VSRCPNSPHQEDQAKERSIVAMLGSTTLCTGAKLNDNHSGQFDGLLQASENLHLRKHSGSQAVSAQQTSRAFSME